jgi:hypothetical protein
VTIQELRSIYVKYGWSLALKHSLRHHPELQKELQRLREAEAICGAPDGRLSKAQIADFETNADYLMRSGDFRRAAEAYDFSDEHQ